MEERKKLEPNHLIIGNQKFFQYMRSIEYLLKNKNFPQIILKARGKNILTAINLTEASKKNSLIKNVIYKTNTETFKKEDRDINVSCIEITLIK